MGLLSRWFKNDESKAVTVINGGLFGFDDFSTDEKLLNDGYASNADVYAIINKISSVASSIPIQLTKTNIKGEKEVIESGEVFDFWQEPFPGVSQREFFNQSMVYLLSSGDLFYRPQEVIGMKPEGIQIYPSGAMSIEPGKSYMDDPLRYVFHDNAIDVKIDTEKIIHIKYMDPTVRGLSSLRGLSPLRAAYLSLEASNDIMKGAAMTVKNQGVRGILTNRTDRPMSSEDKKEASSIANKKLGGVSNFNKIFTTNANLDFIQLGMSADDLKILELGVLSLRQLCNAFGTASVLFGDPANSKFANVHEAEKALVLNAALPNLENKILWTLNKSFMPLMNDEGIQLEVDKSSIEILQPDQALEAAKNNQTSAAILNVVQSPIGNDSKIQILVHSYGMSDMDAQNIVGNEFTRENTTEA